MHAHAHQLDCICIHLHVIWRAGITPRVIAAHLHVIWHVGIPPRVTAAPNGSETHLLQPAAFLPHCHVICHCIGFFFSRGLHYTALAVGACLRAIGFASRATRLSFEYLFGHAPACGIVHNHRQHESHLEVAADGACPSPWALGGASCNLGVSPSRGMLERGAPAALGHPDPWWLPSCGTCWHGVP
jgi:hypothetical protein